MKYWILGALLTAILLVAGNVEREIDLDSLALLQPAYAQEQEEDHPHRWPREIESPDGGLFKIYQPQNDALNGDTLTSHAVISYTPEGKPPIFGTAWFASVIEVDREERTFSLASIEVIDVYFQEGETENSEEFRKLVKEQVPGWELTASLDDLLTSLSGAEQERQAAKNLQTKPPKIIYSDRPALLVPLDGEPVIRDIEETDLQTVVNTPYPLIFDPASKRYYLNAGTNVWFESAELESGWEYQPKPPGKIASLVEQPEKKGQDQKSLTAETTPKIYVAEQPVELLVTEGEPKLEELVGDLNIVTNTTDDIFQIDSRYYVLISGRWYRAKTMDGNWEYVSSDKLPKAFAKIPEGSDHQDVLSFVAGTDAAREAIIDAQVPTTAAVKREDNVQLNVSYDGEPQFVPIENTELKYAKNTADPIIFWEDLYFAVFEGVWYVSTTPTGPWSVSEVVPPDVQKIPPSNPHYNVKYVQVYDSDPDVVYVGYTPGYTGSYVYGPTVVYGTGYYYQPWVGPRYYYPYSSTWGFRVTYNPWTGWGFGLAWSNGPFHFGWHSGGYWHHHHHDHWHGRPGHGWFGPGGYRPGWNNIDIDIDDINIGDINIGNNYMRPSLYERKEALAKIDRDRTRLPRVSEQQRKNFRDALQSGDHEAIRDRLTEIGAAAGAGAVIGSAFDKGKLKDRLSKVDPDKAREKLANVDRDKVQDKLSKVDRDKVQDKLSKVDRDKVAEKAKNIDRAALAEKAAKVDREKLAEKAQKIDRAKLQDKVAKRPAQKRDLPTKKLSPKEPIAKAKPAKRPAHKPVAKAKPVHKAHKAKPRPAAKAHRNNVYANRKGQVYRKQAGQWQKRSNKKWTPAATRPSHVNRHAHARNRATVRRAQHRNFKQHRASGHHRARGRRR